MQIYFSSYVISGQKEGISNNHLHTTLRAQYHMHIIRRIHGAIVAATGRSDRRHLPRQSPRRSPHVYTTGDRRSDNRQLVARLNSFSTRRRSPVVYTRGDCRGDRRDRDSRRRKKFPVCYGAYQPCPVQGWKMVFVAWCSSRR